MTGAEFAYAWQEDNRAAVQAIIKAATLVGVQLAAEHILNVSNKQVPIEEGDLERSGQVTTDGQGTAAISYDTPYAVRQHEDLSYRHDSGRNAKYLENACRSEATKAGKIIAQAVFQKVGG